MRNTSLAADFTSLSLHGSVKHRFCPCQAEAAQSPVGGTVKDEPAEFDIRLSEELNLKFTGVKLTGPDRKARRHAC